jgi:predicted dehydrogenase
MIGFGLIGCGRISRRHLRSLAACRDVRLVAACDVSPERTAQAADLYRQWSGAEAPVLECADSAEMLKRDDIQAVVVATSSAWHAPLAAAALNAGKHVMVEKPMALSLADADGLIRTAETNGLILQICHQLRYRPAFRRLKEAIDAGAMGDALLGTVTIRLYRPESYYREADWRGTWSQDGGMLLNQGIHLIDLLAWYMGNPRQTYGTLLRARRAKETEDAAAGVVHFARGIGVIEATTMARPGNLDNGIALFGERGTVSIGGVRLDEIRRWSFEDPSFALSADVSGDGGNGKYGGDGGDEHVLMYRNFISAMRGKPAMLVTGKEGKTALELIYAIYESYRSGQALTEVPADFASAGMAAPEGWS